MPKQKLTTFAAVLRRLGGVPLAAEITGRSEQNICNFRKRGYFPAILIRRVNDALAPDYEADDVVFRIEPPIARKQQNAA